MRRADRFVFETNMSVDFTSPEITALREEHMFLPSGATLEQILPRDVYENFAANAATFNTLDVKIATMSDFADKQTVLDSNEVQELANAYRANDIEKIRAMFSSDFADEDDIVAQFMQETLIRRRGAIFAGEIERLLRETNEPTTFFVTVGLAHIIGGEAGQVLHILRDRGFDVVGVYE